MSNVLKVSLQTTIYNLAERGWSQRRIARELGINRETVGRYLRLADAKPAISTPGDLAGMQESRPAISIVQYLVTSGKLESEALRGAFPRTHAVLLVFINTTDVYDTAVADWNRKELYSLTVQDCVSFVRVSRYRLDSMYVSELKGYFL